jgi:hypothetical protein
MRVFLVAMSDDVVIVIQEDALVADHEILLGEALVSPLA